MSADLYFTRVSFFFLVSFFLFFRRLISEVAERNWTKIGHMVGSKCNLKTHVRNLGYPLPLQIGDPKTTFFGRLRNLTATSTAYIFGMKDDIDNRSSALTTTRGLLHRPKMSWTLVHNSFKLDLHFCPPYVNSAFHFIVRLRRRRSANGTQPYFVKRWTICRSNNFAVERLRSSLPKKIGGQKTFTFVRFFDDFNT